MFAASLAHPILPETTRKLLQVSELRARLKATSTAFQTREKSLADLREAVRALEQDRRTAQAQARAQTQELGEQVTLG